VRLPRFEYLEPKNVAEALDILHVRGKACSILAGGTDILVRMKQRLCIPEYLMSLRFLDALNFISQENRHLSIGARTPLARITRSDAVQKHLSCLIQAVEAVGAPSIQHHRGTVGGNLCQDSRCLYYNQSDFWRSGCQPCHKAGGKICYAKEGSDRCRATYQSDIAPALLALDAKVRLCKKGGERTLPLADFYTGAGEQILDMAPDELLTEIQIPLPAAGVRSSYQRLSYRSAIDYPIASAGVFAEIADGYIRKARIVVGAMSSAPLLLAQASGHLEEKSVKDQEALEKAAAIAMDHASAFAVNNVGSELGYRIQMVSVLVRRALKEVLR